LQGALDRIAGQGMLASRRMGRGKARTERRGKDSEALSTLVLWR
jgi:hypothetical protein